MATSMTQKEMFAHIAEVMADDTAVVEFCQNKIEQLSKPRKRKINEEALAFAEMVKEYLTDEPKTNKELTAEINAGLEQEGSAPCSAQKVAAALRRLVTDGRATRIEAETKGGAASYTN